MFIIKPPTPLFMSMGPGAAGAGLHNYWVCVNCLLPEQITRAAPIACTNAGPDTRRSCFYVLVSGTLLLSQGLLIGRTPKCVQMLSLRMHKHVQPSPHVCFHCRARCFHFASFFLILQSHGRPFAKNRTSQIWEVAGANTSNFCE